MTLCNKNNNCYKSYIQNNMITWNVKEGEYYIKSIVINNINKEKVDLQNAFHSFFIHDGEVIFLGNFSKFQSQSTRFNKTKITLCIIN
jgi:hypothetical protein